jgi:hypothetical protein
MRFRLIDQDVVSELLNGEAIVIHLTTGTYYSMLASGADIWNGLLAGYSVDEIASRLARGLDSERARIVDETTKFASELVSEGLIIAIDANTARPQGDFEPTGEFKTPELQKYTDMQELVLVDPIHEVTDAGWPLRDTTSK